jgi:hypothetical protein
MYSNERLHGGCQCATHKTHDFQFNLYKKTHTQKRLENMKNDSDTYMTSFCATTSYKTAGHKQKTH